MEPRYVRRRSSQASKDDEVPFMDAQRIEREDTRKEKPAHEDTVGRNEAQIDDDDDLESLNEDEMLSVDSIREAKMQQSRAGERLKWWKVYALHFLFTWNARTYEYASILLVSLAFPNTLFAASLRGITSTVSTMLCASAVGSWIDRAPSRLPPLLITICSNHGATVASYLCWLLWPMMAGYEGDGDTESQSPFSSLSEGFLFGFILLMDVVHDLGATGNLLSLQRDWVPVLVGPAIADSSYGLTQINSVMARIDLTCKLVAPSFLPLIVSNFNSRAAWIILLIVVTVLLWALEVWCAHIIANENEQLRLPKTPSDDEATTEDMEVDERYHNIKPGVNTWPQKLCFVLYQDPKVRLKHYFSMFVWPASISISILQLSVLAYSSTLITYLLEVGYSLSAVTIARATGSIMALSGTFIVPVATNYLRRRYSKTQRTSDAQIEGRVVRTVGLWGVSSQFFFMVPVVAVLWNLAPKLTAASRDSTGDTAPPPPHLLISIILFSFLSLTRIGHWMFYLMVQELEQVEVPSSQRSTFAGMEQSFKSFFELCHWGATMVWSRPEDFRLLALGNLIILGAGAAIFAVWQRKEGRSESRVRYEEIVMDDVGQA